jgi:hypothetical protein
MFFPWLTENHLGTHRPAKDSLSSETKAAAAGGVPLLQGMMREPEIAQEPHR